MAGRLVSRVGLLFLVGHGRMDARGRQARSVLAHPSSAVRVVNDRG